MHGAFRLAPHKLLGLLLLLPCLVVHMCQALNEKAKLITGVEQWPYRAVARALEVIPRTLIQNCGGQAIRTLTALRVSQCIIIIILLLLFF